MRMFNTTKKEREEIISKLAGTIAGNILEKIEKAIKPEDIETWKYNGFIEMRIDWSQEEICQLNGWNALGYCSYSNTFGLNSLAIYKYNKFFRQVYKLAEKRQREGW